ncbi:hypothetical protein CDL15_Pgr002843 [Punica granatum]|uniref:HTH myb-type domain-containing protein n=1 Tax=Punica granatum TaxID=22663 RepID=A0A218X2V3_PUNGR|nr:hypothetical protein CDL15_Pgr002843 [Punica granatum]
MLALSPPRSREDGKDTLDFPAGSADHHQFIDFGDGNLLDCIDFDDLFTDIEVDGAEFLPDLEMVDPDNIGEFSPTSGGEESEVMNVSEVLDRTENGASVNDENEEEDKSASERDEPGKVDQSTAKGTDKGGRRVGRKSSSSVQSKNNPPQGKRKVKGSMYFMNYCIAIREYMDTNMEPVATVDWTPELHRKFVQAVEQLGLDKAVPSKILEIMGMDCLTRHNIASHLQKTNCSWVAAAEIPVPSEASAGSGSGGSKLESPGADDVRWRKDGAESIADQWAYHGFPSSCDPTACAATVQAFARVGPSNRRSGVAKTSCPPAPSSTAFNARLASSWPTLFSDTTAGATYGSQCILASSPPPAGTPYLPQPRAFTGLMTAPPVSGIPPKAMYKEDPGIGVPSGQSGPQPPPDFHPSGETIDAAIGDALKKPWQPLPLGLKPPSLDGVLTELHREGIPDIPPSSPS